jgi:hypothetical protein
MAALKDPQVRFHEGPVFPKNKKVLSQKLKVVSGGTEQEARAGSVGKWYSEALV